MTQTTAGQSKDEWTRRAGELRWPQSLVIDGKQAAPLDEETFAHLAPRDGAPTMSW